MHHFDELVYRSTAFALNALEEVNSKVIEELQSTAAPSAVKNLQMIQLQKVIIAIGMFSMFESILQAGLDCENGFKEAKRILVQYGNAELQERFDVFIRAINVLKHGKGKSYDALVAKAVRLPFRIKLTDEDFFDEGDISEVSTLVEVNDKFVLDCAELIEQVSKVIRGVHSKYSM